jgi:hypothetical protein
VLAPSTRVHREEEQRGDATTPVPAICPVPAGASWVHVGQVAVQRDRSRPSRSAEKPGAVNGLSWRKS